MENKQELSEVKVTDETKPTGVQVKVDDKQVDLEDESLQTIAKEAAKESRKEVHDQGSSERQFERDLQRAMHHNSHLLDSVLMTIFRVIVTLFYGLTLMLAMGFSLNALLQMHFAFFLPQVSGGSSTTTTFIAVMCLIVAVGFICAVWLSRVVELIIGTWNLKYPYLYDLVAAVVRRGDGRRNVVQIIDKVPQNYPWTNGVLAFVDFMAFGFPLLSAFTIGIIVFVTAYGGDDLVNVLQLGIFGGLGACTIVSVLFLAIAMVAALTDPVFDFDTPAKIVHEPSGCAFIIKSLFGFWDPSTESAFKYVLKMVIAVVSGLTFAVLLLLLLQDGDRIEERWMITMLPISLIVFVMFTFLVLDELRVRRVERELPGEAGWRDGKAIPEEEAAEEKRLLAETRDKMSKASLLVGAAAFGMIALFAGKSGLYTGVAVFVLIVSIIVFITANMETVAFYIHAAIVPQDGKSIKAMNRGAAVALPATGGDEESQKKNVRYSYKTIFHRWFYDLIIIDDRADAIRTIVLSLVFVFYCVGMYGAWTNLSKWSFGVLVFALFLCGLFGSVKNSTKTRVVYFFMGVLIFLGVSIIMLGSQVQDPKAGDPIAYAGLKNASHYSQNFDPAATYQICNETWFGFNVVDYAFMANLAYKSFEKDLIFNEAKIWFPRASNASESRFEITQLEDAKPAQVLKLWDKDSNLTVIAIRGTSKMSDVIEDMDMFLESVMIAPIAGVFPANVTATLVNAFGYMKEISPANGREYWRYSLKAARELMEREPARKYAVTGHSLGGAVASVLGAALKIPAITYSPPGIVYSRELFDLTWTDINTYDVSIVPRSDVVPKVGQIGGTIQHIDCDFGALPCHFLANTACQLVRRCGDKELGRSVASDMCEKPKV